MFRELLALFQAESQERHIAEDLDCMLQESARIVKLAGDAYLRRTLEVPTADSLKHRDKTINKLQRQLRKKAFGEAVGDPGKVSLPFCLSVMNVVKDVERIGDYAKDLATLTEVAGPVSGEEQLAELASRTDVFVDRLSPVMREDDQMEAVRLIESGKRLRRDLQALQQARLTATPEAHTASQTLALQFYVRIVSHGLNVLSTLVTPLHHMDYVGKKDLLPEVKQRLAEDKQSLTTEPG